MFGMSMAEIGIIFLIALVFLGPEKLPDLARMLGKGLREVRKAGNAVREAFEFEEERDRLRKFKAEQEKRMRELAMGSVGLPIDQIDDEDDPWLDDEIHNDPATHMPRDLHTVEIPAPRAPEAQNVRSASMPMPRAIEIDVDYIDVQLHPPSPQH